MTSEQSGPRALGRRTFLKRGAGIAAFGGLFWIVGCGGDDDDDVAEPGSALKTALARPTVAIPPTATTAPRATTGSLYDRLGKNAGITGLINAFLPSVALDSRINTFFAAANPQRLSALLVEQISNLSGGPEKYTGRTMKETHAGMKHSESAF